MEYSYARAVVQEYSLFGGKMINKILFHINSLGKGGAERVVTTLAAKMAQMGKEVYVATLWTALDEYQLADGVRRIDLSLNESQSKLSNGKIRSLRQKKLRDAIKETKPDVVFSFCRNANYRAILAAGSTPVIYSVRSDPKVDYASKKQKLLASFLYKRAAGGVFQTEEARQYFGDNIAKKSCVILNPLSEKYSLACPFDGERQKNVVSVGRFHEAKDQLTLIKAFELVLKEHPEYELHFYGDRSEDNTIDTIKAYISDHKLESKVILKGNSNSLEKDIIDAGVFVLPSKYEGMPNALVEAMALGLAVVSTDCPCGGPRMIIDDGCNGLLCDVGDEKLMAIAINKYIEHPDKAAELGKKAREIVNLTDPLAIANEWLNYAEKCIR